MSQEKSFVPQLRPDAAKNNSQIYPKQQQQQQQQTPNLQSRNQDLREKERKQISKKRETAIEMVSLTRKPPECEMEQGQKENPGLLSPR